MLHHLRSQSISRQIGFSPSKAPSSVHFYDRGRLLHVPISSVGTSSASQSGSSGSTSGNQPVSGAAAAKPPPNTPVQQKILNGILGIANVPYSSYVPWPQTFLHKVDARIKQMWLVAIYLIIARSTPMVRLFIAAVVALTSVAVLPPRLWQSQLKRLGILCAILMTMTALFSDGIPPVLQLREPPTSIFSNTVIDAASCASSAGSAASTAAIMSGGGQSGIMDGGLLPSPKPTGYNYVVLHIWFVTVTKRSLNLALTAGALTFCALQSASLCLVTTPGEEMAEGLRWWLSPLRAVGVPVQEIALTLLLSLRFMSLVFEEVRNLCLGLAARGVDWAAHGNAGSLGLLGRLCSRLFGNLFHRSESIAGAMVARGFVGPEAHTMYLTRINGTSWVANAVALGLLGGLMVASHNYR